MLIIGITGTLGAGKGTIVEYLCRQHSFEHHSVRGLLTEIINQRGMDLNRDSMVSVANELRSQYSPSYLIEQLYAQTLESGKNCIIESIRTPGEIDALETKGSFFLFAVDAEPKTRYQRIVDRASATDQISFETFVANEQREMQSTDPNKQNLSACIARADFTFLNNGSIEELYKQVGETLHVITNKRTI